MAAGPARAPLFGSATALEAARAQWREADWPGLAGLSETALEAAPDRAQLALLAAAGLAQLGEIDSARRMIRQAQAWGCASDLIARVLLSGVQNGLGCLAILQNDDATAQARFESALRLLVPEREVERLAALRDIQEKIRLGLLGAAASALQSRVERLRDTSGARNSETRILESRVENVQNELVLMERRAQAMRQAQGAGPGAGAKAGPKAPRSTAQLGQDLWVLQQTGQQRGGFFVEFGATDGVSLSNSFLLETGYGWRGLCSEPNPEFFAQLQRNRGCTVTPDCIGPETGRKVRFVLADVYGGIIDLAVGDSHEATRQAYEAEGRVIELETISLDDYLRKYQAPRRIDYLSIDTEGSEFEILRSFPFRDWDIRLITVEHNFTPQRARLHALLSAAGYRRTAVEWDDWYSRDSDGPAPD